MELKECFTAFAGCKDCMKNVHKSDIWAHRAHLGLFVLFTPVCILYAVVNPAVGAGLMFALSAFIVFSVREWWGSWTFAFMIGGKLHIHQHDPREEIGSGKYRWERSALSKEEPLTEVISGPIFRFRNSGYFFKALHRLTEGEDSNRIFWPMNGVTAKIVAPMRISRQSSIFDVQLLSEEYRRPHVVCVSLERAMCIADKYYRLDEYITDVHQKSEMFKQLWLYHDAVLAYLLGTKDRQKSPVGRHARELLQVSIQDVGISHGWTEAYAAKVQEALTHLEALVTESVGA